MKVLYLPFGLPLDYTLQLANALSNYCEVSILLFNTPQRKKEFDNLSVSSKVNLIWSDEVKFPLIHPFNIKVFFNIIKKIKMKNYDIIHIQGFNLINFLIVIFSRLITNFRIVTTFHDIEFHQGYENICNRLTKFCLEKISDAIFVHGKKLKKILKKRIEKDKIHAIPMPEHNTAPMEKYINNLNLDEENTLLFFGWITYYKGIEYLIRASEIVKRIIPDLKVIIAGRVGKGKYDAENFKKIKRMTKDKNYFELYPHYIPWDFAAELFMRSKIVILPYIECSQSGVVPVAYKFKKPVIATDVGALSEIVEDGKTGFIVPPRDVKSLANKIIKLLKNEKLRTKMGEEGFEKLKNDLSWDNVAKIAFKVYKKCIHENTE